METLDPIVIQIVVAVLILARFAMKWILAQLNRRHVLAHADVVPAPFAEFIDRETYRKSVEYTLAKNALSRWEMLFDTALLFLLLFSGVLPWLWSGLSGVLGSGRLGEGLVLFTIISLISLPSLPLEWYEQFRLEERFGFNNSTLKLWISDKLKGFLIGFVFGYPLILFLLWVVNTSSFWWLYAAVLIFLFQLVMVVIYPMFILPLFNKFEELPEGELRDRLFALGDRTGFKAKTILVMDGSRRSAHSNAYFTGFGKFRRIVLFDTLMEQLDPSQLESVLAHEIGHYKRGHIPKIVATAGLGLLAGFAVLGWLANWPVFLKAFGFDPTTGQFGPVLLLFSLLSGVLTFWLTPLGNHFSRKHEYEADDFAKDAMGGDPEPILTSLRVMNNKNLSNLTPHPLVSAFYYSHPTLLERESHVRGD